VIAGDDDLRRRQISEKRAGIRELLPMGPLREIAGDDDDVGFRGSDRGDQGRHGGAIEATEMQIGQMCDCAQWGSLFVEPGQGSGAVDLQCVYVRFRACEEIRRPLDWSWPAKAGRPVITDARW